MQDTRDGGSRDESGPSGNPWSSLPESGKPAEQSEDGPQKQDGDDDDEGGQSLHTKVREAGSWSERL